MSSNLRLVAVLAGTAGLVLASPAFTASPPPDACAPLADIHFSTPPTFTTTSHRFTSGAVELGGCLYRPKGLERFPVIVLVPGSEDTPTAASIYNVIHAKAFAAAGMGLLSFDMRGLGASGGTPTGTDFSQRAEDVAAAVRSVRSLPSTSDVGVVGLSQAGWAVPQALRPDDGVALVILVSPAGVCPHDQVAFFIRNLALGLGIAPADAADVETLHRTVVRYYATGEGYEAAQRLAAADAAKPWFERFRANDQWDEKIAPGGKLLTPPELARAWKERPGDFEFYRAPSTFADYRKIYERLDRPTLVVQGSADTLVPIADANALFAAAFRNNGNRDTEIRVFAGATHGIQDGPSVRPAYLDAITAWAAKRFAAHPSSTQRSHQ